MIEIEPWTCIGIAFLILALPINWVLGMLIAAGIHELFHYMAIQLLGGEVYCVTIGLGGAKMDMGIPNTGRELLCALAGPIGSFLMLLGFHVFPEAAICGGMQGIFNLLPIYPLDGGRIIQCMLHLFNCKNVVRVQHVIQIITCVLLLILAEAVSFRFSLGFAPVLAACILIIRAQPRKRPCKRSQIKVQ